MYIEKQPTALKLLLQTRAQKSKSEIGLIHDFFSVGLEQLNLYKPELSFDEVKAFIELIDPVYHHRIILYSHYGLAKQFDLGGIHTTLRSIDSFFAKLWLDFTLGGKKVPLSTTVRSIASIADCSEQINEILVGPVFVNSGNNIINMSYRREIFERGIKRSNKNIIVMGGVCEKNIPYLKTLDIKGILLHRTIWDSPDPVSAFIKLRDFSQSLIAA